MRSPANMCLLCAAAMLIGTPLEVRAEGYVTPWIGIDVVNSSDSGRVSFGVTTGYMSAGVFGFEADVGFVPEFSQSSDAFRRSAVSAIGSFILGVPFGGTHGAGVRPFVSGGFGVVRAHSEVGTVVELERSTNAFEYSLGAGVMGFFSQHFGLRGDIRYLGTLQDIDRFSGIDLEPTRLRIWRLTGGVTFR